MQLIYELRHKYKVVDLVKVASIARSTYYYWMKQAKRPDKYKKVKELIKSLVRILGGMVIVVLHWNYIIEAMY